MFKEKYTLLYFLARSQPVFFIKPLQFTGPCGLLYLWDVTQKSGVLSKYLFRPSVASHRSGLLKRNIFEEVEFKLNMH